MSQASDGLRVTRRERLQKIRRLHRGSLGIAELIGLAIAGSNAFGSDRWLLISPGSGGLA